MKRQRARFWRAPSLSCTSIPCVVAPYDTGRGKKSSIFSGRLIDEEIRFYLGVFGGIDESIKLADVAAALGQIAHSMTAHGKERFGDTAFS